MVVDGGEGIIRECARLDNPVMENAEVARRQILDKLAVVTDACSGS